MKPIWIAAGLLALATTATLAHQDVQNPAVLARMENMSAMADHVEVLGNMARGLAPFDAAAANSALDGIAAQANRTIDLFEDPATDPLSEARAGIWDNFANFSSRATGMELLAMELAGTVEDRGSLGEALRRVGSACSGCHEDYRLNLD